jgi:hypothetical protein
MREREPVEPAAPWRCEFGHTRSGQAARARVDRRVAPGEHRRAIRTEGVSMLVLFASAQARVATCVARLRGPSGERGQGTVEYVGLILLVSLLMVGMVAAMKGFSGVQGQQLAEVIIAKIRSAVNKITFR